jgi:hypothetical protein
LNARLGLLAGFAALLAIGLCALLLATAFRPASLVFFLPFSEDGFYALTVARNFAAGRGVTIDGVNWTNGFQPLFTFLEAACFFVARGDDVLAARLITGLSWVVHVVGAILAGRVAHDARPDAEGRMVRSMIAVVLYLGAAKFFGDFYSGLETGLQLTMILALWRATQHGLLEDVAGCVGFGVLLGFAVLARIDVGFLAVALALWVFVRGWPEGFVSAVARPLAMGVAAIVVSSPWWIYNHVVFGSIVPSSGTAQQSWGLDSERLLEALWALRMVLVPWIFAGASESLATDLARSAILALALALFLFAPHGSRRALASPTSQRTSGFGWCLFAAMCALAVFYVGSFFAYWFYFRYFAPLSLLAIIGAATVLGDYATRGIVGAVSTAVVLAIVAAAGSVLPLRAFDGRLGESPNYPMVDLVAGIVPPGDVVAAGQSGTLGFFRPRVVNVDGKVNREALAWQDRMWVHLAQRDIRWFVDSPWYVERMLGKDPTAHGWQLVAVAGRGEFQLWRRD